MEYTRAEIEKKINEIEKSTHKIYSGSTFLGVPPLRKLSLGYLNPLK